MSHALCPNGHGMWNGDGKPDVWAFRVGYFRDFMKAHPDCKLDEDSEYWQLYDCVDDIPGEDLNCWYCDECKGLVVYVDIARYDFKRMETIPDVKPEELAGWEEYIALRDRLLSDISDQIILSFHRKRRSASEQMETACYTDHTKGQREKWISLFVQVSMFIQKMDVK